MKTPAQDFLDRKHAEWTQQLGKLCNQQDMVVERMTKLSHVNRDLKVQIEALTKQIQSMEAMSKLFQTVEDIASDAKELEMTRGKINEANR